MLRHGVHRVVVQQADGQVAGVLEALDVFSFLSNHSLLIDMQLRDAASLDDLAQAAGQITAMIGRQFRCGGAGRAAGTAGAAAQRTGCSSRAWQLLAPEALVRNSCLLVMGSEGRGEQLLRTDQDNALLLRDGYEPPQDLADICERFSAALARFGYPPCSGGVMLNQPSWRGTEDGLAAADPPLAGAAGCRTADGSGDLHGCTCRGRRCVPAGGAAHADLALVGR